MINTFWEHKRRYDSRRISKSFGKSGGKVGRYKVSRVLQQWLKSYPAAQFRTQNNWEPSYLCDSPNLLLDRVVKQNEL